MKITIKGVIMKNTKNKSAKRIGLLAIALVAVIGFIALSFSGCFIETLEPDNTDDPEQKNGPNILNNAVVLTQGEWTDGNLPSDTDEQWFTFVAADNTQNIFFETGTLKVASLQLYEDDATTTNGSNQWLLGSVTVSQTTANKISYSSGKRYYIKIYGFPTAATYGSTSGTFKIAFSNDTSPAITVPSNATQLTIDTPADSDMPQLGEQWFKFTAGTNKVYLKFNPDTSTLFTYMNIQLYDASGNAVGESISVTPSDIPALTVTSGNVYYIRASGGLFFSGAYKISVNTNFTTGDPIDLTIESWSDSVNIENIGDEVWFKFTAGTDMTKAFIQFAPETLTSGVYADLFDDKGNMVGESSGSFMPNLSSKGFISRTVTSGKVYYIRVKGNTPSSSESDTSGYKGTFKIAVSKLLTFDSDVTDLPTDNSWYYDRMDEGGEFWFKFTATATTQYIHFDKGYEQSITSVNVLLYDENGAIVGSSYGYISFSYGDKFISRTVTVGKEYYIKVTPGLATSSGFFLIGIKDSATPPATAP
jgi:hypothetical protein